MIYLLLKNKDTSKNKFYASQAIIHMLDFPELGSISIKNKEEFWRAVWDFTKIVGDPGSTSFIPNKIAPMTGAKFFPEAKLNLAENLLQGEDDFIAVIETDEQGKWKLPASEDVIFFVIKPCPISIPP